MVPSLGMVVGSLLASFTSALHVQYGEAKLQVSNSCPLKQKHRISARSSLCTVVHNVKKATGPSFALYTDASTASTSIQQEIGALYLLTLTTVGTCGGCEIATRLFFYQRAFPISKTFSY